MQTIQLSIAKHFIQILKKTMFFQVVHHWKEFKNDRLHAYFNN